MELKGLIVAVCAVIVALASVAGLMTLTDDWADMHEPVSDAVKHQQAGWRGLGQFDDLKGDEHEWGEVFDSTVYYTSHDVKGTSEKIIVGGGYINDGSWISCGVEKQRHRFYIWDGAGDIEKDGEDGWIKLSDDQIEDGEWTASIEESDPTDANFPQGFNLRLDGLYKDGATIRDEFQIKCYFGDWITMMVDEARLIRGDGELTWGKDRYTVGVHDSAKLKWFVPGIRSEVADRPIYKIFVTNENTGHLIYDEYVDDRSGSINIKITDDMAEEGGENRLIARLWNDIFQRDITHAPVRILGGFYAAGDDPMEDEDFPQMNSITTDRGEYLEGEIAVITIDATMGRYPIDYYFLLCEIEGTEVVNIETESETYNVQVSVAGILECEATAYDIYGNPSVKSTVKATVTNALLGDFCDRYPDDPACKITEPGLDWIEALIIILLVVALLALVFLEFWGLGQVGLDDWRILLAIIGSTLLIGMILIGMQIAEYMLT